MFSSSWKNGRGGTVSWSCSSRRDKFLRFSGSTTRRNCVSLVFTVCVSCNKVRVSMLRYENDRWSYRVFEYYGGLRAVKIDKERYARLPRRALSNRIQISLLMWDLLMSLRWLVACSSRRAHENKIYFRGLLRVLIFSSHFFKFMKL